MTKEWFQQKVFIFIFRAHILLQLSHENVGRRKYPVHCYRSVYGAHTEFQISRADQISHQPKCKHPCIFRGELKCFSGCFHKICQGEKLASVIQLLNFPLFAYDHVFTIFNYFVLTPQLRMQYLASHNYIEQTEWEIKIIFHTLSVKYTVCI